MAAAIDTIFQKAAELHASDVHLAVGTPIMFRIDGDLHAANEHLLKKEDILQYTKEIIGEEKFKILQAEKELDSSYQIASGTRFRVNCAYARGDVTLVARIIPQEIPTMEDVELQGTVAEDCCHMHEGLVLLTGPTGCGKSTSMAAMIDEIRTYRKVNIITLEDPVEYIFPSDGRSIIRQRQYGDDFLHFPEALKRVLRQDPDVVMVGEMRDLETISTTLTLAETGHLVLATLHTPNAMQTIDRIIDVFPPHQQNQVRSQLSLSLKAVIAQRLVPRVTGGLAPIREILVNNYAVANMIRDKRTHELTSAMQMGAEQGMISFEMQAKKLRNEKQISPETYNTVIGTINTDSRKKR